MSSTPFVSEPQRLLDSHDPQTGESQIIPSNKPQPRPGGACRHLNAWASSISGTMNSKAVRQKLEALQAFRDVHIEDVFQTATDFLALITHGIGGHGIEVILKYHAARLLYLICEEWSLNNCGVNFTSHHYPNALHPQIRYILRVGRVVHALERLLPGLGMTITPSLVKINFEEIESTARIVAEREGVRQMFGKMYSGWDKFLQHAVSYYQCHIWASFLHSISSARHSQ